MIGIAAIVAALDQFAKAAVVAAIGPGRERQDIELLGDVVRLDYAENRGAAFGLFSRWGALLTPVAIIFLIGLVWYFARSAGRAWPPATAIGLIVGGALGNLVDRIRLGYVVDFVAVGPWPKFNVADSAISVGVVMAVILSLASDGQAAATSPPEEAHGVRASGGATRGGPASDG